VRFFEERRGRLHGFRWKDHADFKSCAPAATISALDQTIGTGDGATASFPLVKRYGTGLRDYMRPIVKPVSGTVIVAVNGVASLDHTVDHATGTIAFAPGAVPPAGAAVTAGFEFDVPARFDTDLLRINLAGFAGGDVPEIPIVEVRP